MSPGRTDRMISLRVAGALHHHHNGTPLPEYLRDSEAHGAVPSAQPEGVRGTTDPFIAEGWIRSQELYFEYLQVRDGDRIRCTIYMLRDDASLWWEGAAHVLDLATITWARFKELFSGKYFPADVRGRLRREFMSLRQGDLSVAEFIRKFDRGCHFVPLIARDADQKLRHFLDGLKPTLHRDVMLMRLASYDEMTACAFQADRRCET
ncbi:uncharacterized protein LOC142537597 [Primulina tabacum]|uniref:uncharacterized protein LOC142537597 n=1 Tax=Primulina tabacum TaxID=48773 RepID=UPI003F5A77A2